MIFAKEVSPHIRRKDAAWVMMLDVLIALAPTLIFACCAFPVQTISFFAISSIIMVFSEFVFIGLTHMMPKDGEKHTFKEKFEYAYKGRYKKVNVMAPLVSAAIYTLILPPGANYYAVVVGAFVGIILGKLVFGGLGSNIFNPAAVGMVAAKLGFGGNFVTHKPTNLIFNTPDIFTAGTALSQVKDANIGYSVINDMSLKQMILGNMPGTLGEVYTITILIGLAYLLIRHAIDFRVVCSYFGTFALMMLIAGAIIVTRPQVHDVSLLRFLMFEGLTGGVLFGGVFMITDPVTGPITKPGRVIFGMIAGVVTVLIRLFGSLPEGVAFSILVANMFVPVIDFPKWSSVKYNWKNMLAMGLIFVIPTILMIVSLMYGGIVK